MKKPAPQDKRKRASKGEPMRFLEELVKNPPEQCVIWPYAKTVAGYGYLTRTNLRPAKYAHRTALALYTGIEPQDLSACHGPCHNPLCVNPLHLSWKTHMENQRDKFRDKTQPLGENHPMSKLTDAQALEVRSSKEKSSVLAERYSVSRTTINQTRSGRVRSYLSRHEVEIS